MASIQDLADSLDEQASQQQDQQHKTAQIQAVQQSGQQIVGELQSLKDILLASPIAKDKKVAQVATKLAGLITQLDEATSSIRGANFKPLADNLANLDKTIQTIPGNIEAAHQAVDPRPHLEELNSTLKKKNFQPIVNVPATDLSSITSALTQVKSAIDKIPKTDNTQLETLIQSVTSSVNGVKKTLESLRFPSSNFILPYKTIDGKATQVKLDASGNLPVNVSSATVSGSKGNNTVAPGTTNLGTLPAVANAGAPSFTEGNQVALSTDLSGAMRVTGSLSVGGTTDNSTYTAGTSTGTPTMGFYHSVIDSVTDGRAATVAITPKRALMANLQTSAGVETGVAAVPLQVSLANTAANTNKLVVTADPITFASAQSVNATLSAETTKVIGTVNIAAAQTIAVTNAGTFAVQATLGAETTKVIGTVRTADGSGNLYTSNSTTFTAKNAQDTNLLGTLGTAFSTAGKVDVKGADGDIFVRQATGTNLHTVLDSGTLTGITNSVTVTATNLSTNLAQVNGVTTLAGNGASGTGAQRVTIASDSTGQIAPAANATATGASFSYQSALNATKAQIKATAGNLYGYHIYNNNSVVTYIQCFNKASASVTVGTTAPDFVLVVPPNGWLDSSYPVPITFGTGLTVAATTTASNATNPTNSLVADFWFL